MKDMDIVLPGVFVTEVVWSKYFIKVGWILLLFLKWLFLRAFFCSLFSKCRHAEQQDNHLKPTPNVHFFPNFFMRRKSFLISLPTFKLLNFEKWTQLVLRNLKFGDEIFQFFRTLRIASQFTNRIFTCTP